MSSKMVEYRFDPTNPPPLTDPQREQLARLAAMPDSEIYLTDIPEMLDWSGATRGKFYRPVKQQVTLRLDADVPHCFKSQGGPGYQTRINATLRKAIDEEPRGNAIG